MLAVCASHTGAAANVDVFSHKSSLNNSIFFNLYTGHENTVNDLCALAYFCAGKKNGIFYFTFYNTALCNNARLILASGPMY